jgi:hypothetical protein
MNLMTLITKSFWVGLIWIAKGVVIGVYDGDWQTGGQDILTGLALIAGRDAVMKLWRRRAPGGDACRRFLWYDGAQP